jgi:hypothetical protein
MTVDYFRGIPVLLADYLKPGQESPIATLNLNKYVTEKVPKCVVFYDDTNWSYKIMPVNERGQIAFPKSELSEQEYIQRLYFVRGLTKMPDLTKFGKEVYGSKSTNAVRDSVNTTVGRKKNSKKADA